jgi:hypothetical protein
MTSTWPAISGARWGTAALDGLHIARLGAAGHYRQRQRQPHRQFHLAILGNRHAGLYVPEFKNRMNSLLRAAEGAD